MKSTPTPRTKTGRTARELTLQVGGPGKLKSDHVVPRGTRVHFIGHGVVQDLSWLSRAHFDYHDADHYGITVDAADVVEIEDAR